MNNNYSHLPLRSLLPQFDAWAELLNHNQTAHICFLPHSGYLHRIYQFKDYFTSAHKAPLAIIDMIADIASEPQSLEQALVNSQDIPTILIAHKFFLGPDKLSLAQVLQTNTIVSHQGLLVIHETASHQILSDQNMPSIMYHQVQAFTPIIDRSNLENYIKNIAQDWKIKLQPNDSDVFIDFAKHQLWLINELLRLRLINPNMPASGLVGSPSIGDKSQLIWDSLPALYKNYYLGLQVSPTDTQKVENELTQFALPLRNQTKSHPYLDKKIDSTKSSLLQINGREIRYQSHDYSHYFSNTEKSILAALSQGQTAKSREEIGEIVWPSNSIEQYSDWALDQLISRIRKKLTKYQLPISIQTLRGKGYALSR